MVISWSTNWACLSAACASQKTSLWIKSQGSSEHVMQQVFKFLCAQVRYFCNVTGEDCSACRYHCIKMPDVDLSPTAYADGKFPPGCSSTDFVRIDQADFQVCSLQTPCIAASLIHCWILHARQSSLAGFWIGFKNPMLLDAEPGRQRLLLVTSCLVVQAIGIHLSGCCIDNSAESHFSFDTCRLSLRIGQTKKPCCYLRAWNCTRITGTTLQSTWEPSHRCSAYYISCSCPSKTSFWMSWKKREGSHKASMGQVRMLTSRMMLHMMRSSPLRTLAIQSCHR